jgi:RHS repeat-associated protein
MTPCIPQILLILNPLGNVRVTFTTATEEEQFTATFEDNTQSAEAATFRNYSRVSNDMFDHTDAAAVYTKSQMLNGTTDFQIGVAKSIAVGPGDVIKADVFVKYFGPASGSSNLGSFATALLSAFNLPTPGVGEVGTPSATMQAFGSIIAAGSHPEKNDAHPKGWLNILVFDKNHNLVDMAFQQVDAAYSQPGGTTTKAPHQLLSKQITVKQPGYVYIYLSNEGAWAQEIYFDDFKITHTKSPIIQIEDYYPFGLTFNSWGRDHSLSNNFKYNGKEEQDELDLGWLDYGARMYDPTIGRWSAPDALAEFGFSLTPFRYCFNNPVNYVDPLGLWEKDASGNYSTDDEEDIERLLSYLTVENSVLNNNPSIAQINGFIAGEESESGLGELSDGSKLVSAITVNGYQQGNRVEWYTDKKSLDNAWHDVQGSLTPDALDPRTLGINIFDLTYPGGDNPTRYNGDYDYSYRPMRLSEYPAIGHDRRYDNLKAVGASALFTDSRTIGADWKFVSEEFAIASLPIGTKTRVQAFVLGLGLGIAATGKTVLEFASPQPSTSGAWFSISDKGVTNNPQ